MDFDELRSAQFLLLGYSLNNVEIGGHTVTHPILTLINNASARAGIEENKRQLETITGKLVGPFVYLNEKRTRFRPTPCHTVRDAVYTAAFMTAAGARRHDRFARKRSSPARKINEQQVNLLYNK